MTLAAWLGFLVAAIVIAVTPGPGAVISMSTGMRHGYWAALTAILGESLLEDMLGDGRYRRDVY